MRWRVHRIGALWCAHRGESGKPRAQFETWSEAAAYAVARVTIDRLEAVAELLR